MKQLSKHYVNLVLLIHAQVLEQGYLQMAY